MVTAPTRRPPKATMGYVRIVAAVVTLFALSTASRAAQALLAPTPGAVAPALLWAALLVAIASTAIAWLRPRFIALAIIGIPLGFLLVSWDLFDDPSFAATIAAVPVVLVTLIAAWAYLALPFLAWRQVRLPARLRPCADMEAMPASLRAVVEPLRTLGFEPIATLAETEKDARLEGAILVASTLPVSATVLRSIQRGVPVVALKLSARPVGSATTLVSVADQAFPEFLPTPDSEREFQFPGAPAVTLLANLRQLVPALGDQPARTRDAWMALLDDDKDARMQWWIAQGWVDPVAVGGEHRITLRGAFAGVWRMLWPGRAIAAARRRRAGVDALSGK
jgi:hypothetical protein